MGGPARALRTPCEPATLSGAYSGPTVNIRDCTGSLSCSAPLCITPDRTGLTGVPAVTRAAVEAILPSSQASPVLGRHCHRPLRVGGGQIVMVPLQFKVVAVTLHGCEQVNIRSYSRRARAKVGRASGLATRQHSQ